MCVYIYTHIYTYIYSHTQTHIYVCVCVCESQIDYSNIYKCRHNAQHIHLKYNIYVLLLINWLNVVILSVVVPCIHIYQSYM